jgi:hypothetical protein
MNNRKPPGVTEYTIFGLYVQALQRCRPYNIAGDTPGEPVIVSGRVSRPMAAVAAPA